MRHRDDVRDARFFKFRRGTLKRLGTVGKIRVGAGFGNIFSFVVGQTDDADLDAVKVLYDGCGAVESGQAGFFSRFAARTGKGRPFTY